MGRPVTLFTGQWADLPVDDLAAKCAGWGFDGLELACWGDHFDVAQAVSDPAYAKGQRELLARHDLGVWAIGNHLVGQAVCDPIDGRHESVLPPEVLYCSCRSGLLETQPFQLDRHRPRFRLPPASALWRDGSGVKPSLSRIRPVYGFPSKSGH